MDVDRRRLLIGLGIAGGIGVGAGIGLSTLDDEMPPAEETDVPRTEEFETVVNAVAAGADPNGEELVNPILDEYAGDDTLLVFPDGTFLLEPITLSDYDRLGIVSDRGADPTFVAADGNCIDGGSSYVHLENVADLLLDGIAFDFTGDETGGIVRITATGDATVRDVSARGECAAQIAMFRLDVLPEAATAIVENLQITNQSTDSWLTGVFVGKKHAGDLIFRNCSVEGFTDNGLYASAPGLADGADGIVHVDGGTYRNNNVANVRLGSAGSVARGVTSISDSPPPSDGEVTANARGFRLRSGHGQLIDGCEVQITGGSRFTHGGIVFHETNGGARVQDTRVEIDRDETPAIRLFPRDNDNPGSPVFEDIDITGTAAYGQSVLVDNRDETVFRNCTIKQSGKQRNAILFRDSADCRLVDSTIDVTNHPLILRNATVLVENSTLITPDGREEIDEMEATDGDFTPESAR